MLSSRPAADGAKSLPAAHSTLIHQTQNTYRADKDTIAAQLHHQGRVGRGGDAAGRKVDDREMAELCRLLHQFVRRTDLLRVGAEESVNVTPDPYFQSVRIVCVQIGDATQKHHYCMLASRSVLSNSELEKSRSQGENTSAALKRKAVRGLLT
jgi:hypothetical protein